MPAAHIDNLRSLIAADADRLTTLRRELHQFPELGYNERRTSERIVAELQRLGVEHRAGLAGGTGVVAHLPSTSSGGGSARTAVALRADMDALPIHEQTGREWSSRNDGVMHACGHDGHMTILLGAVAALARLDHRPNPVTFLFQPAEEGGAGGERLCADGALDGALGPPAHIIYGLHGWPTLDVGLVATKPGALLAATDNFRVVVHGAGSHAAYPHFGADPLVAAAHCVTALQTIASRNVDPIDSVVVTVAAIQGGEAHNVIADACTFLGTVRTLLPQTRRLAEERLRAIVTSTAQALGCRAEVVWTPGYPSLHNHPDATSAFFNIARQGLGESRVRMHDAPGMGGEDFAYYALKVPACFFLLGLRRPGEDRTANLHSPRFDFNDEATPTGVETFCRLALEA